MKRRNRVPSDSLDLLLDTICNTFGGIIFIALLVVVLLQVSGQPASPSPQVDLVEETEFQNRLETLSTVKTRLEANLEKQLETVSQLTDVGFDDAIEDLQTQLSLKDEFKSAISDLEAKTQAEVQDDQEIESQRTPLQEELRSRRSQIRELEKSLADHREARRRTLRMPVAHRPESKVQVIVILQYNRAYFWHRYTSYGLRDGLNTEDFLVLSDDLSDVTTTPDPTGGIPLDESEECRRTLTRQVSRFSPKEYYVAVIARPDSYGAFQHLREVLTSHRLEYDLRPTTWDVEWSDRGGSGGLVQ